MKPWVPSQEIPIKNLKRKLGVYQRSQRGV
jgi:hypothetical protein